MTQTGITLAGVAPTGIREADGVLVLGAATPLAHLAALAPLERRHPALLDGAALAAPAVGLEEPIGAALRAALAPGGPGAALAAALLALDAALVLADAEGPRAVPLEAYAEGSGEAGEGRGDAGALLEVRIPDPSFRSGGAVERGADGTVAAVQVSLGDAAVARGVRVAVVAPGEAPVRARAVERALLGRHPDEAVTAAAVARLACAPGTAAVVARATARAVERALGG